MGELSKLPNIGEVIEEQLNQIGIHNYDQLKEVGSKQAWLKIKNIDASACYNRLCGIEGAVQGIKKTNLSQEIKAELKEFYNTVK